MSIIGSNVLAGASGSGVEAYEIEQSLRFDGNAYIDAPDDVFGNEDGTYSFWVKRSELGAENTILWNKRAGDNHWGFRFDAADTFTLFKTASGSDSSTTTTAKFRDPSAWYHILVTTTSSANEVFVNGTSVATGSYEWAWQDANPRIGYRSSTSSFQGYLAEWHYISGSVKSVSDFTETDDNGVLRPIEYEGSYGTNGYYLKFDETDTNGILHDSSGQANHFNSSTGLTTSGGGTDVMSDTPTNSFATFNPLNTTAVSSSDTTLDNGNLDVSFTSSANNYSSYLTHGITSGKYYFEVTCAASTTSSSNVGFVGDNNLEAKRNATASAVPGQHGTYGRGVDGGGTLYNGSGSSDGSYMAAWEQGDIIMIAIDADNEKFYLGANGKWADGSGNTDESTLTSGAEISLSASTTPYLFGVGDSSSSVAADFTLNAGQREFAYSPGTYSGGDYFNVVTYTGDNTEQAITGVGFQPDLVWVKCRNQNSTNHILQDVVRGAEKYVTSDTEVIEGTSDGTIISFDSDGFTIGAGNPAVPVNNDGDTFVAWCWKAGGTASSNTDGSITSSVSANQDAGFSVVTYTGTGANATVGHGLGAAVDFILIKSTSNASSWQAGHTGAGWTRYAHLDLNNDWTTASEVWQDTAPTSTVFSLGTETGVNGDDRTYVAYCWAEKTGVSKFGSYTGNGSDNGPEVTDLGFAPALVVIKRFGGASEWAVYDSARGNDNQLRWDTSDQDNTNSAVNVRLTNNGFKVATDDSAQNGSGETYLYMAWARDFTVDADYKALNTANLPAPEVKDGTKHFDTKTYTANNSTAQSITGLNFSPDLLWFKTRSRSEKHIFYDTVRGAGDRWVNTANESSAETTGDNSLTSFDSNGFSLGIDGSGIINYQTDSMVAWAWEKGSEYGFNIVEYTGDDEDGSGNIDVSHGLGVTPEFCIVRNLAGNEARVWHIGLGNTLASTGYPNPELRLTNQGGSSSPVDSFRGFSSTIARFGPNGGTNQDGNQHIAYFWTGVEGFSKFGTYAGNGSSDGPFIYTGFKVAWLMVKKNASSTDWKIYDAGREPYNVVANRIAANTSNAELDGNAQDIDFVSNGFKFRGTNGDQNSSGTFYYAAFASNPFGGEGVSPATAR